MKYYFDEFLIIKGSLGGKLRSYGDLKIQRIQQSSSSDK